ncbi:MAG: lysine--tRNA ligase [Lachnospiraceae bacterium]|nr:lysine--tRNA ligase [Lachnospiraceae bacterium]
MAEAQNRGKEQQEQDINQLLKVRREKLAALQESGKDPFQITKYDVTHHSQEIKDNYDALEGKKVSIAGRVMSKRIMGKASFCNVQDLQGDIQCYVARDSIGEEPYAEFKKYDVGDIVGIEGEVFTTKTGEISLHVEKMTLLSKSLQILPEKYHGLVNTDIRYRQRYTDLIMNEDVKKTFVMRSKIISSIRRYLDGQGFLEVETPMLVSNAGGAAARPFETHYNALDEDVKLRISLELYLKRLIVGGMERVYEIGRVFRNEGLDARHNPEFTLMELYQAYTDYYGMMDLTENMFRHVAGEVCGTTTVPYGDVEIDLGSPFARMTMTEAVKKYAGVDFDEIKDTAEAKKIADEKGVHYEDRHTKGDILNLFFEEYVEEHLVQPTFIMDHPIEISPLTKKKPDKPDYVERFELFITGREMCNAYSELNDPIDQRERFKAQEAALAAGDEEANTTDEDFMNALEIGMPPTGGIGYGIDRLVMLLTNSPAIRDVLLFPTMKSLDKAQDKKAADRGKNEKKTAGQAAKTSKVTREQALDLLKKYNKEPFHIQHALTVEGVMRWFAKELGYGEEEEFWGITGLLHDIDFELYPEEHCKKAPELLREGGVGEDMIYAVCSHGYGLCSEEEPKLEMEKVLFASDELTGLIWSCALMRPSRSTMDLEVKSLKKKFKDKKFAAGCSRDVIAQGAEMLGWELDDLFDKTILAMRSCEAAVAEAMEEKA